MNSQGVMNVGVSEAEAKLPELLKMVEIGLVEADERSRGGRFHQRVVLSAVFARHCHVPLGLAISVSDIHACRPVA